MESWLGKCNLMFPLEYKTEQRPSETKLSIENNHVCTPGTKSTCINLRLTWIP
jgi:hypothetical protein